MALFSLLLLSLAVNSALSARIAGFWTIGGSQYLNMKQILEELASRGHEVTLVVHSAHKIKPREKVAHKIYQVPYKPGFLGDLVRIEIDQGSKLQFLLKVTEALTVICESFLNSTELQEELKGFDLIVYDSLAVCPAVMYGERFGIPRVEIVLHPNYPFAFNHMVPMPVSYVPQAFTGFSDKMTFMERVVNLGAYLEGVLNVAACFGTNLFNNIVYNRPVNPDALKAKYNITPERSFQEAVADAELVIFTADFALEYAQPLLPGNVMVGSLNVKDGKPYALPPDLEEFVSNSGGHGFIIVSFGTNVASLLPKPVVDMLATAFGKLKQRVVWRLEGYIPSLLGTNIKVMDWLPQNDLLAHKDIKAFFTHAGHNSLYESAYHGVPVVAVPIFVDQHSNAKKVENFGLGLAVDYKTINAQQLFETIERVIAEPRFKNKAMYISGLLKDRRRTPLQETSDWIEYVLRHGGAGHLRAQVFNIPWYQYYLLDVMAFLVAIVTLVVMAIRLACGCLCRVCCKKSDTKTKKE
ncbi:hypothetical protein ACROYT_G034594 [Oculina patagonica]